MKARDNCACAILARFALPDVRLLRVGGPLCKEWNSGWAAEWRADNVTVDYQQNGNGLVPFAHRKILAASTMSMLARMRLVQRNQTKLVLLGNLQFCQKASVYFENVIVVVFLPKLYKHICVGSYTYLFWSDTRNYAGLNKAVCANYNK